MSTVHLPMSEAERAVFVAGLAAREAARVAAAKR